MRMRGPRVTENELVDRADGNTIPTGPAQVPANPAGVRSVERSCCLDSVVSRLQQLDRDLQFIGSACRPVHNGGRLSVTFLPWMIMYRASEASSPTAVRRSSTAFARSPRSPE